LDEGKEVKICRRAELKKWKRGEEQEWSEDLT